MKTSLLILSFIVIFAGSVEGQEKDTLFVGIPIMLINYRLFASQINTTYSVCKSYWTAGNIIWISYYGEKTSKSYPKYNDGNGFLVYRREE